MSPTTLRILIGLVLLIHGIGHVMAFFPALNIRSTNSWHHRSWLVTPMIGDTASRVISILLFGVALVGFIATTLGLFSWLVPHDLWRAGCHFSVCLPRSPGAVRELLCSVISQ